MRIFLILLIMSSILNCGCTKTVIQKEYIEKEIYINPEPIWEKPGKFPVEITKKMSAEDKKKLKQYLLKVSYYNAQLKHWIKYLYIKLGVKK